MDFSEERLRLTIRRKRSRYLLDARSKFQPDFDLHRRLFIPSFKGKSGIGFGFYRIRIQRTFILDPTPGIHDPRNLDSYGESAVDQKIPSGSGDFSLDSLRSDARSLCGDRRSRSDRSNRFKKIECISFSAFDFCNVFRRIFTFFHSRIFGEGKRDPAGHYPSHSVDLSILFLVPTDPVLVHGFFTFRQRLESP